MKKIVNNFVLLLGMTLVSVFAVAAGNPAAGEAKTAVCAACHGADGNSAAPNFPKLAGLGEKYLIKQMEDIRDWGKRDGARNVPEMTGMLAAYSEQDLADIAAFYDSKARTIAGAKDKGLEKGQDVYRGGNLDTGVPACTGCHSPAGQGNSPAGYPALGGQHAAYIAKQLQDFRAAAHDPEAGRSNDGDAKVMRGVAAQMNDVEIEAVSNFISGLK